MNQIKICIVTDLELFLRYRDDADRVRSVPRFTHLWRPVTFCLFFCFLSSSASSWRCRMSSTAVISFRPSGTIWHIRKSRVTTWKNRERERLTSKPEHTVPSAGWVLWRHTPGDLWAAAHHVLRWLQWSFCHTLHHEAWSKNNKEKVVHQGCLIHYSRHQLAEIVTLPEPSGSV